MAQLFLEKNLPLVLAMRQNISASEVHVDSSYAYAGVNPEVADILWNDEFKTTRLEAGSFCGKACIRPVQAPSLPLKRYRRRFLPG